MMSKKKYGEKTSELFRILLKEIHNYWDENKEIPLEDYFPIIHVAISNLIATIIYHFLENAEHEDYPGDNKYFACVDDMCRVAKDMLPFYISGNLKT